ncbi:hypothetical protein Tco_0075176 [Tanacetum coccineum]
MPEVVRVAEYGSFINSPGSRQYRLRRTSFLLIRCRSEVEEAIRMISSTYSRSRRAWKGDLGIGEEVVTCKVYLGLAFTIPTLERVIIGCCEVGGGGGGGGVVGGVGVVYGDGVDRGVGGVDCGVVCGFFVCGFVVCGGVC